MTPRKTIPATLLPLAVLGIVAWQILRSHVPNPIFEGQRLSYWVEHYNGTLSGTAKAATRQAGTNAIPLMLRLMRARDSAFDRKLIGWTTKHAATSSLFVSAEVRHWEAADGFGVLGSNAQSAVPELMRIYKTSPSKDQQFFVIMALGGIGPAAKESIPLVVSATTSSNQNLSMVALTALGQMRVEPDIIVPALIRSLNDPNQNLRMCAVMALGQMRVEPDIIVPVLIKSLNDPFGAVQAYAVEGLGNFGPQARAAVPRLLELELRETFPPPGKPSGNRTRIENALKQIDPSAAANAGIK